MIIIKGSEGEFCKLFKDSLYQSMQQSDWALFGIYWFGRSANNSTYTKYDSGSIIQNYTTNHQPEDMVIDFTIPASKQAIFKKLIDSAKMIDPIYNFSDDVMVCGGIDLLLFDGKKFYYLSNGYGQQTKQIMETLSPIYQKYF